MRHFTAVGEADDGNVVGFDPRLARKQPQRGVCVRNANGR
jgi:hypothetical protein